MRMLFFSAWTGKLIKFDREIDGGKYRAIFKDVIVCKRIETGAEVHIPVGNLR